jgi:hypothetical protein
MPRLSPPPSSFGGFGPRLQNLGPFFCFFSAGHITYGRSALTQARPGCNQAGVRQGQAYMRLPKTGRIAAFLLILVMYALDRRSRMSRHRHSSSRGDDFDTLAPEGVCGHGLLCLFVRDVAQMQLRGNQFAALPSNVALGAYRGTV